MIEISNIEVFNFKGALRGMRNPMESWDQSDSSEKIIDACVSPGFCLDRDIKCKICYNQTKEIIYEIGQNDLKLAQKLVLAGTDHSKFMRQIFVSFDVNAPLYWYKEFDTYKVATVANSTSTMHKLSTTPITRECFSFDEELNNLPIYRGGSQLHGWYENDFQYNLNRVIDMCEWLRESYLATKDIQYWRALIQLLPESWNQIRTCTMNYATLRNIYFARRNHKLKEWHEFCEMIENLPYGKELICIEKGD